MASAPPQAPPESIILGSFRGVRNTVGRDRLSTEELMQALNVDIDDVGAVRRRRGQTPKIAGSFHSVREIGGRVLGVKDGRLGVVGTDYSFRDLGVDAGVDRISYTQVERMTFFSSISTSGRIIGDVVDTWGASDSDSRWVSPVMTPTDTLGEVFGTLLYAPPLAEEIEAYSGRIYMLAGQYIWATELFLFDYVDRGRNFIPLEAPGTLLAAMNDGLYVGTTSGLFFLSGTLGKGLKIEQKSNAAVVRGSAVRVPGAEINPQAGESMAVVFLTEDGVMAGFDGGQVTSLTRGKVALPKAVDAAALYREDRGVSAYVVAANSGGGVEINARIGDFIDADVVRAADR